MNGLDQKHRAIDRATAVHRVLTYSITETFLCPPPDNDHYSDVRGFRPNEPNIELVPQTAYCLVKIHKLSWVLVVKLLT